MANRIEPIERASGTGSVTRKDGTPLGEVNYDLRVYQRIMDVGTKDGPESVSGLISIEGQVEGLDSFALMSEGAMLTLRLEDGRELEFFFKDIKGRIAAGGGLHKP